MKNHTTVKVSALSTLTGSAFTVEFPAELDPCLQAIDEMFEADDKRPNQPSLWDLDADDYVTGLHENKISSSLTPPIHSKDGRPD